MNISKYLSYREVTKSYTATKRGINNLPSESQLKNIIEWARCIFDPIRSFIDTSLGCHTIYRSPKLNTAIGGSEASQHMANNGAAGEYTFNNNCFDTRQLFFGCQTGESVSETVIEYSNLAYFLSRIE